MQHKNVLNWTAINLNKRYNLTHRQITKQTSLYIRDNKRRQPILETGSRQKVKVFATKKSKEKERVAIWSRRYDRIFHIVGRQFFRYFSLGKTHPDEFSTGSRFLLLRRRHRRCRTTGEKKGKYIENDERHPEFILLLNGRRRIGNIHTGENMYW